MFLKRGDIIWLSRSLSINLGKNVQDIKRPYVVISNNTNNAKCPTINVAALTKQESKSNYPMHVLINKDTYGLEYSSVIYVEQILTVNIDKVTEKICSLNNMDLERLNKAIYIQLIDESAKGYHR